MNARERMDLDFYKRNFARRDNRNAIIFWLVVAALILTALLI